MLARDDAAAGRRCCDIGLCSSGQREYAFGAMVFALPPSRASIYHEFCIISPLPSERKSRSLCKNNNFSEIPVVATSSSIESPHAHFCHHDCREHTHALQRSYITPARRSTIHFRRMPVTGPLHYHSRRRLTADVSFLSLTPQ